MSPFVRLTHRCITSFQSVRAPAPSALMLTSSSCDSPTNYDSWREHTDGPYGAWQLLSQVSPAQKPVAVFLGPAVADVFPIVHVGNHDVPDAVVRLPLRLLHRRSDSAGDQHDAGRARDDPLAVDLLHVLDVQSLAIRRLEEDHRILRTAVERLGIVERKRWNDDSHADLEAAASSQSGQRSLRHLVQELADR